jgi:hypothetical protein
MPISAARQFLIRVSGIDGYFAERTGGEMSSDASREFDGGSLTPEVLAGPATPGDLTVRRPYKPERDAELLRRLRPLCGRWRTSISSTPTDRDLVAVGSPTVWTGVLTGVNDPEADASSGDAARIELTFAVELVS